jgi:allantoin racemase
MSTHVRIITPHITPKPQKLVGLAPLKQFFPGLELSQAGLENGPVSIEGSFDEALCAPEVIARALEAEREGVDALVIDCMGDPGLEAAREAVAVRVLGSCETTLHVAATLGHKFSVVTVLDRVRPLLERRALAYGVNEKIASIRSVNVPVLEIEKDTNALVAALLEQSKVAIQQDHADTIVLGCTGFIGVSDALEVALRDCGLHVPVLNRLLHSVSRTARSLFRAPISASASRDLSSSRVSFRARHDSRDHLRVST